MLIYEIEGTKIKDWNSFHHEFKNKMSFPDYYGENMDAWIDCVDELCEQPILINIEHGERLKNKAPHIFQALLECSAFINHRRRERGDKPNLLISTRC